MSETKKQYLSTESEPVEWTNDREHPAWWNHPLDCFLLEEKEDEKLISSKLVMFSKKESDLWRNTSYDFYHDSGHAFLNLELKENRACEIGFSVSSFKAQFDQGGVLVREVSGKCWLKSGVEFADGFLQISAVLAQENTSDWSVSQWPVNWENEHRVIVRVSRNKDALTVRIRLDSADSKWRLLRLCPMKPEYKLMVGPYACAPTREGHYCEFFRYSHCEGDSSLH